MTLEPQREVQNNSHLETHSNWESWGGAEKTQELQEKKEVLSKIVGRPILYWSGHVANWAYVLSTLGIAVFLSRPHELFLGACLFAFGFWVWGLLEYVFHRWAYHKNASFMAVGHLMHHDEPEALIGMPWVINLTILVGIFLAASWLIGTQTAGFILAGIWMGHISYTLVHHGIHNWNLNSAWFRKLKAHHKIHHKLPDKNLGVTTIYWDRLFRTRV
jgi:hypothetical protein